ncbi:putative protein tyrosine phosphatase [Cavenderia fasciculata]|uniref:protein-tyrosine-phosphatase n=1 Tax=Cavenderia fasciculata TaxID=261658 RepID=F4PRS4_CACFS|nr:putative protein tyrosine phosphatase [Cavenderia fasciculata]EGG20573.1 putative protein tyrosine phosphatase [Cavenderia fasciculata]|eukprot:XP_004358423.1 putative protein tyrosine phosphatase [Cavenderia fasciculata]
MTGVRSTLPNPASVVESTTHRFLIFDAPNDDNLSLYMPVSLNDTINTINKNKKAQELQRHNIHHLVRACDPTYSTEPLSAIGIQVHDLPFPDGGSPSDAVVDSWLRILKDSYKKDNKETIGVHCVAGLGRAPVLVAIALIESGMNPLQAVDYIREKRRGSINIKQIKYLKEYKSKKKASAAAIAAILLNPNLSSSQQQ